LHGLILAGGEGSRLEAEGVRVPKPLLPVAGEPLIARLIAMFAQLGCETVTCMIRADFPSVFPVVQQQRVGVPVIARSCRTSSSLHTLALGLREIPAGPVFCTMVDSVMPRDAWRTVYTAAEDSLTEEVQIDALLAVTPFVDDESPLYVRRDAGGLVQAFAADPIDPPCVTGGVYGFGPRARQVAGEAVDAGVQRMRGYLQHLISAGARIGTIEVSRIIDVDHESDLRLANAWLGSPETRT
jgi:NDP-sugar pyrophosphorylase family protein